MKCFIGAEDAKVLFEIKRDSRSVHFSDVALINVGITTGSNRFSLSLDDNTSYKYELDCCHAANWQKFACIEN